MTKNQKIDYLYRIAKGERVSLTPEQRRELNKYRVDADGEYSFYLTKKNLSSYITAVDNSQTRQSFRDWCWNTGHADKRFRNSDKKSMQQDNFKYLIGWAFCGSFFWMIFLSNITNGGGAGTWMAGAVISGVLSLFARKYVHFVTILLPLILVILVNIIRN